MIDTVAYLIRRINEGAVSLDDIKSISLRNAVAKEIGAPLVPESEEATAADYEDALRKVGVQI